MFRVVSCHAIPIFNCVVLIFNHVVSCHAHLIKMLAWLIWVSFRTMIFFMNKFNASKISNQLRLAHINVSYLVPNNSGSSRSIIVSSQVEFLTCRACADHPIRHLYVMSYFSIKYKGCFVIWVIFFFCVKYKGYSVILLRGVHVWEKYKIERENAKK